MCDESNQPPNTFTYTDAVFSNSSGGTGLNFFVEQKYRFCLGCNCWVTGVHLCGLAAYQQPVFTQPERKPHTCPVCTGTGKVQNAASNTAGESCPACKGACVLWG